MQRFANMMSRGLAAAGVPAELIQPQPLLGRFTFAGRFAAKWLGYVDKFLLFPRQLKRKLAKRDRPRPHLRPLERDVCRAHLQRSA